MSLPVNVNALISKLMGIDQDQHAINHRSSSEQYTRHKMSETTVNELTNKQRSYVQCASTDESEYE